MCLSLSLFFSVCVLLCFYFRLLLESNHAPNCASLLCWNLIYLPLFLSHWIQWCLLYSTSSGACVSIDKHCTTGRQVQNGVMAIVRCIAHCEGDQWERTSVGVGEWGTHSVRGANNARPICIQTLKIPTLARVVPPQPPISLTTSTSFHSLSCDLANSRL